jgi:FtsZ-binding cell division protein ZapB
MLNFLKRIVTAPLWRLQMEARVEALEARAADLADRFKRFQSRESMREARAAKNGDQDLQEQVKALLGDPGASQGQLELDKTELWRRRRTQ